MVAVLTASPTRSKVRPHVSTASSRRYERRRPEKTPLYKVVAEHLEGWLEARAVAEQPVSTHIERELRSYLTCGILCFGFGRARCASCGQGFVVAFSCKGRGVCPSCNGRRMAQTAAHLVDRIGVFVPNGDGPPALLRASCLPKTVAGSADHPGRSGHARREGAPSCRALVPHAAVPRRRRGCRNAPLGKQWFLGGRQRPDHAHQPRRAELLSKSRASAEILCPAALRAGTALRDPRRRRPQRLRPLRAPPTQGGQLGRPGARGDAPGDRCDSCDKPRFHDTSRRQRPNSWPGWGRVFARMPLGVVATSD